MRCAYSLRVRRSDRRPRPAETIPDCRFTLAQLQKLGLNLVNTAWIYFTPGLPHSEELIGAAIKKHGRAAWIIVDKVRSGAVDRCHIAQQPYAGRVGFPQRTAPGPLRDRSVLPLHERPPWPATCLRRSARTSQSSRRSRSRPRI
jgi:hypothetical protein